MLHVYVYVFIYIMCVHVYVLFGLVVYLCLGVRSSNTGIGQQRVRDANERTNERTNIYKNNQSKQMERYTEGLERRA